LEVGSKWSEIGIGLFLASFLPFQKIFAQGRPSESVLDGAREMMDALAGLERIPEYLMSVEMQVWIWNFITAGLVGLVLWMVVSGNREQVRADKTQ
jgi:hypothetical protein